MQSVSQEVKFVIVSSDEPWCEVWHTQLHYAYQLSKRFHVIFIGPPAPWKFSNLFSLKQDFYSVSPQLNVISYYNLLPAALGKFSLWINDKINEYNLKKVWRKLSGNPEMIFWHFDPFRSFYLFKNNKNCRHVYHVIDPVAGLHLDIEFATTADLVIVTSPKFLDHYKKLTSRVIQIGQGVDLSVPSNLGYSDSAQSDNALVSKNSILLLGTISNEIDFNLIAALPLKTGHDVVIIGPDKITNESGKSLFKKLLATKGVHWLGAMKPDDFLKHVKACAVGIIAYDNNGVSNNNLRSPLKVISYLAAGKCIISNIDCEIPSLTNIAIYKVDDELSFIEKINNCYLGNLHFDNNAVDNFLNSIDYDNLLKKIFSELNVSLPNVK